MLRQTMGSLRDPELPHSLLGYPLSTLHLPDSGGPAFRRRISVAFVHLHASEASSQIQTWAGWGTRKVMRIQT